MSRIVAIGAVRGLGSLVMLTCLVACGGQSEPLTDIGMVESAVTGADPLVDVDYVAEVTVRGAPVGVTFTDLAVGPRIFLARSDGKVEQRLLSDAAYESFVDGGRIIAHKIDYVSEGSGWDLIGANNNTRKISRSLQKSAVVMGDYPVGVTGFVDIAAVGLADNVLKIYVAHSVNSVRVLRVGQHTQGSGVINWESTAHSWSQYSSTVTTVGTHAVYSVVDYIRSFFCRYPTSTFSPTCEPDLPPHTEHAYHHPEGADDRFAPIGMDYRAGETFFYGLDQYSNAGRRAWVVAKVALDDLQE